QRAEQADRDRLAVAVARVTGRRFDRVSDGVAEVEHLTAPAVPLVLADDGELGSQASQDDLVIHVSARAYARPQAVARDESGLDHLRIASRQLCRWQGLERRGVDQNRGWLPVRADVVLALREVDAGLSTVCRVDLGDERRRYLDVIYAALIDRGTEPRKVAH